MTSAPLASAPTITLPYRFGASYLLFDRVGIGGMAEIYLARGKTRVGATRLAVVKLVLPALAGDSRFAQMLIDEAKLAAQLSHANIVQTYDLGREAGRLFIAMEYVEGFDLNELLRRCSRARVPLPPEFALFIAGEVLRALDYAHRRKDPDGRPLGIVHRDVSPSNVLLSVEGEVKLCDFGIARAMNENASVSTEAIEGKAAYMSPEHATGAAIDGRADVFAASIVLWEILAGRRLYKSSGDKDVITLAREAEIPELPDRGLPNHARLAAIVMRGLQRDPAQRYPTALAMARELDAYAADVRLVASPLRLGAFLSEHFGTDMIAERRARELAAAAIDRGPVLDIQVLSVPRVSAEHAQTVVSQPQPEPRPSGPPREVTSVRPRVAEVPAPEVPAPLSRGRFAARIAIAGVAIAMVSATVGWLLAHR